jgi:hypothetical protein
MNLFKLLSVVTDSEADQADIQGEVSSEPRVLSSAEVAAVAGGPSTQNDG